MASRLFVWKHSGVVSKGILGLAIATPTFAAVQGCLLLQEYRLHHGHAPSPIMPTRGVVVVSPQDRRSDCRPTRKHTGASSHREEPLRLLVIGDSLAAGVGMSKSGTPALPESMARALSKAMGGRVVYWTCTGRPGACTSEIAQDIGELPPPSEQNCVLRQQLRDWQFSQIQKDTIAAEVRKWWTLVQARLTQLPSRKDHWRPLRRTSTVLAAVNSLNTSEQHHYDVVIVLTGLNDLKKNLLPSWLLQDAPKTTEQTTSSLKEELVQVLVALRDRMKPFSPQSTRTNCPSSTSPTHHRPLIVFPSLPTTALPMCQQAPLGWFLVPLFRRIDDCKKHISEVFPNLVVFVDSPTADELQDLKTPRHSEQVLLQLTDVKHAARERVEQLMRMHYTVSDETTTLIAEDNVHPNDKGYDVWGRHIAAAIVQEWKKETNH